MRRCLEAARQGQATDAEDLTPLHTEGLLQWGGRGTQRAADFYLH